MKNFSKYKKEYFNIPVSFILKNNEGDSRQTHDEIEEIFKNW